jgi:hypothetical protein
MNKEIVKDPILRKDFMTTKAIIQNYAKTKSREFVEGCITAMYDSCIVDWDIYEKILLEVIPELYRSKQ